MKNIINLNRFKPRDYQIDLCRAFDQELFKRYMAIWPRRCKAGTSHIIMADGSWKYLKDIQEGDEILSWDGSKFVSDKVKFHWYAGIKPTKIVQSYSCLPTVSSNDHVYAVNRHSSSIVHWKKLNEVSANDCYMQYAGMVTKKDDFDDFEVPEFLGYMLSDGFCNKDFQAHFTNTNSVIIDRVYYLATNNFNVRINVSVHGNATRLGFSCGFNDHLPTIKKFFRDNLINSAKYERRLPSLVWNWSEDKILSFFAGIISGDGNIYVHKRIRKSKRSGLDMPVVVEITLNLGMSDYHAWDCYWLLRKIGILPQVPYKERGSNWKIRIAKCLDIKKILSKRIYGKENAQKLALDTIASRNRQARTFKGCFRFLAKIQDGQQEELYDIETENHHNFIANGYLVHNSGKDICAINLVLRAALKRVGTYFYVFPTFSMGRRILWDAIDIDGRKVLSYYIPDEIVESRNEQQMRVRLINGSQIQILGSDDVDKSLVGTNAVGIVFSEYALQDPRAWQLSIPILKASNGWALFISTTRGKNHFFDLYNVAKENPDWFCQKLTVEDTKHISLEEIEKEIKDGQMSRDLALQEFWNDWSLGVEGSYFGKYIDDLRKKNQICPVMIDPYLPVITSWDLGYNDPTTILFVQLHNNEIRVIDCYENNKQGLDHYARILKEKGYVYDKHIAPFDIAVHDLSTGVSRWRMMKDLGVTFVRYTEKAPSIDDGIEVVRRTLPRMWIDEKRCAPFLKAVENYRQEYDPKKRVYKGTPLHDDASHWADCLRYLCVFLSKYNQSGSSSEEIDRRYNEAMYGNQSNLPPMFR